MRLYVGVQCAQQLDLAMDASYDVCVRMVGAVTQLLDAVSALRAGLDPDVAEVRQSF